MPVRSPHASRYLLICEAPSSTREVYAFTVFERLFKERSLPANIRSDNGGPFASPHALFNLSKLAVWWLRLSIGIERIKPGHPQQNGRHERMHLTLKKETTKPAGLNFLQQQACLVITFGGGARDQETFAPEGQENIPHLIRELISQSAFFTQVVNRGILGHYVATASLATGDCETINNATSLPLSTNPALCFARFVLNVSFEEELQSGGVAPLSMTPVPGTEAHSRSNFAESDRTRRSAGPSACGSTSPWG